MKAILLELLSFLTVLKRPTAKIVWQWVFINKSLFYFSAIIYEFSPKVYEKAVAILFSTSVKYPNSVARILLNCKYLPVAA